jgi:hypothetical protein
MEKVGGLFTQFFAVDRSNPQAGLGQVASNGKHPGFFCRGEIPEFIKRIQRIQLSGANQKIDHAAFARQQFLDEPPADKTGCSSNKVLHERLLEVIGIKTILE